MTASQKRVKQPKLISDEVVDEWLKTSREPEDVHGLLRQLTNAVVERAMQAEMTRHLATKSTIRPGTGAATAATGISRKNLKGDFGEVEVETPRDRNGGFESQFVRKNQTRWKGFHDKILSMYARRMSTRDIQRHLEMYQVEVSPSLISEVTDSVIEDARAWQNRPLERSMESFSSMRCTSGCDMKGVWKIALSISHSASIWKGAKTY